ncbi:MAG: GNAT family N-acetyltransferase [Actinomycetota bacterium]|nr:GNAT family N-acetyltransferase [Actinomycetota bacterium]
MPVVRPARPDDAEPFAVVIAAVADEGDSILTEAPVDVAGFSLRVRQTIRDPHHALLVLVEADEVVGCLGLHPTNAQGVSTLGMAVLEGSRGRGGGGALLDAALSAARERGIHKVELEVFCDNARAIGLYASRGFAVEGVRREHHLRKDGSRRSALLMALLVGEGASAASD